MADLAVSEGQELTNVRPPDGRIRGAHRLGVSVALQCPVEEHIHRSIMNRESYIVLVVYEFHTASPLNDRAIGTNEAGQKLQGLLCPSQPGS